MAAAARVIQRRGAAALAVALAAAALWQIGGALYIPAKAALAQLLLRGAWAATLAGEDRVRPWPWADSWPVARLRLPDRGLALIVLSGASGHTLAFGPGHLDGTPLPGTPGNSVVGGHRDTSLRFLEHLTPGERILVDRPDGKTVSYRVSHSRIADARRPVSLPDPARPMLALVTCYPFDAVTAGGPLRYLVFAEAAPAGNAS